MFRLLILMGFLSAPVVLSGQDGAVEIEERIRGRIEVVVDDGKYLVLHADTLLSESLPDDVRDLIFVDCQASVDCVVPGTVIMVGGELGIRSRAVVGGDLIVLGGRMFKSRKSVVSGEVLKTSSERCLKLIKDKLEIRHSGQGFPLQAEFRLNRLGGFALDGYDRVDGFSISWRFRLERPSYPELPLLKARVITSTTRKAFGFDALVHLPVDKSGRCYFGFRGRSLTDTNDRWRLDDLDNAFKSFLAGHDHRYYFRREGYSVFFRRNIGKRSRLGLTFQDERYSSLVNQSPFTLFGTEEFQPNLPVAPGTIRSLLFELLFDTRNDLLNITSGFQGRIETEIAGGALGGGHGFSRLDLSIKRWDTFGRRHHTFFWFKGAFADSHLPFQRGYTMGNTLRGYDNFAFSGDRMLLMQASYGFTLPLLPLVDYLFFNWRVETVYEAGVAFFKDDPALGYGSLKHDLGGGFYGDTIIGRLGLHLFQNLDEPSDDGPRFTMCLNMRVFGGR
ncbi:BamA/TamA family outer membrane protein [Gemmatimonadota bacterium]